MIASSLGGPAPGSQELAGRVAVVTGASRNIGRAIALSLAAGGAAVVVSARQDRDAVEEVVSSIRQRGGAAIGALGDVSRPQDVESVMAAGNAAFGRLDILVNNAAVRTEVPFRESHLRPLARGSLGRAGRAVPLHQGGLRGARPVGSGGDRQHRRLDGLYRRRAAGACRCREGWARWADEGSRARSRAAWDHRKPCLPWPHRDRAGRRSATSPSRNAREPRRPPGHARRSGCDGAVPLRSRGAIHHRPDRARERWRLPSLTVGLEAADLEPGPDGQQRAAIGVRPAIASARRSAPGTNLRCKRRPT